MAGSVCRLEVLAPRRADGWLRLEADLRIAEQRPRRIWFEVETPDETVPPRDARPFVLASLVAAMRAGLPLEADAPLDDISRRNLRLWQGAFAAWRPALMSLVDLRAPSATPPTPTAATVTAFSGGADSYHSLVNAERDGFPLAAGALVQGFDIPLGDDEAYARAFGRVSETLGSRGLAAHRIRTNVRSLDRACHLSWQHETHGAYLAGALACLSPWYGTALIPSSFGYEHPVLPWASNALTDPLLSGAGQRVIHHGGELMRVEKLVGLARDAEFARTARVCYLNGEKDANCGRCYKCATLQVAFWTVGIPEPAAFPARASLGCLATMNLPKPSYRHTYRVLADRADKAGLAEVAEALRSAVARSETSDRTRAGRFLGWLRRLPMR